jgi:hypothetical protein
LLVACPRKNPICNGRMTGELEHYFYDGHEKDSE